MGSHARGILALGVAAVVGCGSGSKPQATPEQLKGRLDAANGVSNTTQRNDALKAVAEDAADAGIGDVTLKAVEGISNSTVKNEVAETCALKLARRGDTKAATAVADQISNSTKKNEVLAKIAKGG